jgi:hypothetical protein
MLQSESSSSFVPIPGPATEFELVLPLVELVGIPLGTTEVYVLSRLEAARRASFAELVNSCPPLSAAEVFSALRPHVAAGLVRSD